MRIGFDGRPLNGESDFSLLQEVNCDRIYIRTKEVFVFEEIVDYLRPGDTVVVANLSRVGTSLSRVVSALEKVHEAGAKLEVANTDIASGTPLGDAFAAVCAILAQDLGALPDDAASFKRNTRGRPAALSPETKIRAERLLKTGSMTVAEIASVLSVSPATIYRHFPRSLTRSSRRRMPYVTLLSED
jgi:DNA invertase Pin-like site-specific DNA recombinase